MNFTSRMTALLGELRRQRNGAVADSMRYYGTPYGLNYGVSLPTVRDLARREGCDEEYARHLWQQDVRELRLAALHVADPSVLTLAGAEFWAAGIVTSELAEEAAYAWLPRAEILPELFDRWTAADAEPLLCYAALLAGARVPRAAWCRRAVRALEGVERRTDGYPLRLVGQACAALLAAAGGVGAEARAEALRAAGSLDTAAGASLREELEWRL